MAFVPLRYDPFPLSSRSERVCELLPLDVTDHQAAQFQEPSLLTADLLPLDEQDRDVVESPQPRWAIDPFQAIDLHREDIVLDVRIEDEGYPSPQDREAYIDPL